MPNLFDLDAPVPVVVEDSYGTILSNEINIAVYPLDEFAVVRQTAGVHCGDIHVLTENQHVVFARNVFYLFKVC